MVHAADDGKVVTFDVFFVVLFSRKFGEMIQVDYFFQWVETTNMIVMDIWMLFTGFRI